MGSLEKFSEEMTMEFGELRWFIGESSSLKLTVVGRSPHSTESLLWRVVSFSPKAFEFIREDLFIILDIVS